MFLHGRLISRALVPAVMAILVAGCLLDDGKSAPDMVDDSSLLVAIEPGTLRFYPSGEYLRNGHPVGPPLTQYHFEHRIYIMKRQVSESEYDTCVVDQGCKQLDRERRGGMADDLPVVGVSWRDATDYAHWLSQKTGHHYRLPSYAEWIYAAGPDYREDRLVETFDPEDPAQRWLAEYRLEAQRRTIVDAQLRPFGGFGQNAAGVQDMLGNVWDWTDTCHIRYALEADVSTQIGQNCGVRVVAGPHHSVITDFIRDPKGGACSVGIPPTHLSIRLVRDDRI